MLSGIDIETRAIKNFIKESTAALHLCSIGYDQDVEFISRVNVFDIVPVYDGKLIKKADRQACSRSSAARELSV